MPAPGIEKQLHAPTRTYSLSEAATILCGSAGPNEMRWLTDRLRGSAEPRLSGYKAQRRWRMTEEDLAAAVQQLRPKRCDIPDVSAFTSMTARSRRRLVS